MSIFPRTIRPTCGKHNEPSTISNVSPPHLTATSASGRANTALRYRKCSGIELAVGIGCGTTGEGGDIGNDSEAKEEASLSGWNSC
jgi:hypothetical protein